MMYIILKNGTLKGQEIIWNVGNPVPKIDVIKVVMVQADGDELGHIESEFSGLPMGKGRVIRWFGDHARFIMGNL